MFSQLFRLTFYTKWFIFIDFFSYNRWMILLGPYNTSDYPLILLVEPTYYIVVPM